MSTTLLNYCSFTDEFLFDLVKQDDKKAFNEIYERYWAGLVDVAYKSLLELDKAEDVVQDIFISLYQRRMKIELSVSLRAYLYKSLKFKILNEYRSQAVRATYQKNIALSHNGKTEFANVLDAKKMEQLIARSVEELPAKCKNAFLLSRENELSYKDISEKLDISVSTVEKHISKALKSIRMSLVLYL
ncbi:MAG: RNA polymerase sigma-70 factor [Niabella sp.]